MSTHFKNYNSAEGEFASCGRFFATGVRSRGISLTTKVDEVSCQRCLGSDHFKKAVARLRPQLDAASSLSRPASNSEAK